MKKSTQISHFSLLLLLSGVFLIQIGCKGGGETSTENKSEIDKIETPAPKAGSKVDENKEGKKPKDNVKSTQPQHSNVPSSVVVEPLVTGPAPVFVSDTVFVEEHIGLMKGRISYRIPDTIKVNEVFIAAVMVSDTAALEKHLIEETAKYSSVGGEKVQLKEVRIAEIQIGEIMRAVLFEPGKDEHFTIKPEGMQEQQMIDKLKPELLFQWTVVANNPGTHPLVLNLEAVFYKGEKEVIQKIPVFTERVLVESLPDYSWLKYAFGGLIAAIISGLFMYFRPKVAVSKIEDIVEKIGQGETAEAIKMLKAKKLSNTNENLLVNHLAEFNAIRRKFNGGMIERADMQMVVNRIHNSLLEMCDEIGRK